jgi:MFS transporter, ACS family, glucarate transporter
MIMATVVTNPLVAATLIATAVAASMFTLAASWSTCLDIGGNHAGVVSAAMNTSGALSSVISPLMVTWLLKNFENNWNLPLLVMGGLFLMGAVCWCLINPHKKIFD